MTGCVFFEFGDILEWHWAGFLFFFPFIYSLLLAFIIAGQDQAERDRNRKDQPQIGGICFFAVQHFYILDACICRFGTIREETALLSLALDLSQYFMYFRKRKIVLLRLFPMHPVSAI